MLWIIFKEHLWRTKINMKNVDWDLFVKQCKLDENIGY